MSIEIQDSTMSIENQDSTMSIENQETFAEGQYSDTETYAQVFDKTTKKRRPKAGAIATAGVGRARASNRHFEAKAKGPNANAKAEANILEAGATARAELGSASLSVSSRRLNAKVSAAQGILDIIDNFDRPGTAYAEGTYAGTDTYAYAFENEPGKRVPKAGAIAEAGVGRAGASWSIFQAEAKGPNASAKAEANILQAGAMARAELGIASASAGPANVKIGLGVDTGVQINPSSVELNLLGTGVTLRSESFYTEETLHTLV